MDDLTPRLRAHVEALSVVRHAEANASGFRFAQDYIGDHLGAYGFRVEEQEVTGHGTEQRNLVARSIEGNRGLLIEAHYDTVEDSPGADDNASGLAVILEAARLLGPTAGVTFASFCLEEDKAQGARVFAESLQGSALPDAVVLDMVGYTKGGWLGLDRSISVVGLWPSRRLAYGVTRACLAERQFAVPVVAPRLEKLVPDIRTRGEHAILGDYGLRAVMLTDGANYRNPHYHSPTDLPATLDYDFMARITCALRRFALRRISRQR